MRKRKWQYLFALGYFFLTLFLFLLPGAAFPKETWFSKIPLFDKLVHVGLFFVLVLMFCWAGEFIERRSLMVILAAAFSYGIAIEIVQHLFVANRSFDWGDWLGDMIGSFAAILVWGIYKKNRPL